MNGKVYLVGAGPGEPDLLTIKAVSLIKAADIILYDDLVSPEILSLASPQADLRNVGKRCGKKKNTQEEINFLMTGLASMGKTVVRLKSGDPLIFGRLGEEIEALREAGIEFEIVPGVTSAFGAAATTEIPLTHRRSSHAVTFLTAHRADSENLEWRKYLSTNSTLVVYMPGQHYSEISDQLLSAGAPSQLPCAIVSRATSPDQKVFVTNVADLSFAPQLPAPTLLIVGDVVRFASDSESYLQESTPILASTVPLQAKEDDVA